MTPTEKLIEMLLGFTDEQLERFITDPITVSILQPEEASPLCQQGEP